MGVRRTGGREAAPEVRAAHASDLPRSAPFHPKEEAVFDNAQDVYQSELNTIRAQGLYKDERVITSPQAASIASAGRTVLNFCANNYLGLSSHPEVVAAAAQGLQSHGFGMSSVRFICGTQDLHKQLESTVAHFFGMDDTILYSSCFDANAGLFETLLGPEDAIISDALNHASIIDGVRLCKAERHRYAHSDMNELEAALKKTQNRRLRLIATDGVFSMDGDLARLRDICDLADRFHAMVMVDDSHATGFMGDNGRGTPEHFGVADRVDIITSTLGKALGGASGGFTTGHQPIIDLLRQRSRPYLFSNSLAPAIAAASIEVFRLLDQSAELRVRLHKNAAAFRDGVTRSGFTVKPGQSAIVPVMTGDAKLAQQLADLLLSDGIYVVGFSYPVVPKGEARVRVQLSAEHSDADVARAVSAFHSAGESLQMLHP